MSDLLGAVADTLSGGAENRRPATPSQRHVWNAIDFVTRRYREPLTVASIAAAVGISVDHLAHLFSGALRTTVKDYVTHLRILVARRLLADTDAKLDAVAEMSGFTDASHLSRIFTERVGRRPGQYRRQSPPLVASTELR